jgi:hypothetical protein
MPTKQGVTRPRTGLGLSSQMTENATTKRTASSAKPDRNRNRGVASSKPKQVARRHSGDKR